MEGRRSLVDLQNSGTTGGVGGFGGAWSTGSAEPSLLSSPVPLWSLWTTSGEIEVGIMGISEDN